METEIVDVPTAGLLGTLTTRYSAYKSASSILKPYARTLLQNTLNNCAAALTPPRSITPPSEEDWPRPEGWDNTIYPNVAEGTPLKLLYPAS